MPRRARKWFLIRPDTETVDRLLADGAVQAPVLATLLASRGLTDPESIRRFLGPKLTDLHSPFLLPGIEAAAAAMWERDNASRALGMELLEVRPGFARMAMTVREDMVNGHGNNIHSCSDRRLAR